MPSLIPVKKHARLVWALKILCALVAVGLVSLLVMLPMVKPMEEKFKLNLPTDNTAANVAQTMKNPRFQGIDSRNEPYNIVADIAIQKTKDVFLLENIRGDILLASGEKVSLTARNGALYSSEKIADLSGAVQVFLADGQELYTEFAHIDMKENTIASNKPVSIHSLSGILYAKGFKAWQNDNKVVFTGPVKVIIYNK